VDACSALSRHRVTVMSVRGSVRRVCPSTTTPMMTHRTGLGGAVLPVAVRLPHHLRGGTTHTVTIVRCRLPGSVRVVRWRACVRVALRGGRRGADLSDRGIVTVGDTKSDGWAGATLLTVRSSR